MSVAPFLPGLVAPAPEAGTTTGTSRGTSTDAQPGAAGDSAFLDALAAALAVLPGAPPPPPAPAPAGAPAGTPAGTPAPAGAPAAVTAELGFVTPELGVSTAELGFVTAEMALDPELAIAHERPSSTAAGVSARPAGEPAATTADLPAPIGATTTTSLPSQRRDLAVHADTAATPTPADVPASRSTTPTPGLDPVTIPNSSMETPNSSVTNPNSSVTNPNSAVETPHSGVTNPTPVERAVVQQVFPEVTRLVSSGNGTHRITLTLQPEQLGEVRVTLVVRDGTVRVRMSGEAGDGAVRAALASGAPELQRMLERAGATEARVLVRDAITPASMPSSPVQAARQDAGGAWSGSSDQFGQSDQSSPSSQSGHSRGEDRTGRPGHLPGHPDEPARRPAAAAGVVPASTPTAGRLDRNL